MKRLSPPTKDEVRLTLFGARLQNLERSIQRKLLELRSLRKRVRKMIREAGAFRPRRRGPKGNGPGGLTMRESILKVLQDRGTPMSLAEIARAILKLGYRTHSDFNDFRVSIAHALGAMRGSLRRTEAGWNVRKGYPPARGRA